MLSARAYSFRQQAKLAVSLSWIGGYTNVITLLVCGWVTSHVTGTTTSFGKTLAESAGPGPAGAGVPASGAGLGTAAAAAPALFFGFLLLCFWLGAVCSGFMTEWAERGGRRSKYVLPMAFEAVLLSVFSCALVAGPRGGGTAGGFGGGNVGFGLGAMTGLSAFAMGLQNATITRVSGAVVRTTHLTGVVTDLGLEAVQYLLWFRDQSRGRGWRRRGWRRRGRLLRVSQRHPGAQRLLLLGGIFGSFLFGVVAGAYLFRRWPGVALWPPVAFLGWICFLDWWKPIADVKQIDLLSDPELKLYGILHSLLPPALGIYRLAPHRHGPSRAPHFQAWAGRLPGRWRVVILALAPTIKFTSNAALDLGFAARRLADEGKRLVLCGVHPGQYRALDAHGVIDKIGEENVFPDLEFAVARGIELCREGGADIAA